MQRVDEFLYIFIGDVSNHERFLLIRQLAGISAPIALRHHFSMVLPFYFFRLIGVR